ncbi:DUF2237 domain-containing protein [Flavobacterium aureirubrum]
MKAAMLFLGIFFITSTVFSQKKTAQENCIITNNKDLKVKKMETTQKNVLGTDLQLASKNPLTGFYRTGFCSTDEKDRGVHVVAAVVTDEFLNYSLSRGNDLISPYPASGFPGLKAGNIWCLCAMRWKEALDAGVAPPVILEATNIKALQYITLEDLKNNQVK